MPARLTHATVTETPVVSRQHAQDASDGIATTRTAPRSPETGAEG